MIVAGMSLGPLFTHLRRVRLSHPLIYERIRGLRLSQLAERHDAAMEAAREHSDVWFRRERNRRYYYRFGHWP